MRQKTLASVFPVFLLIISVALFFPMTVGATQVVDITSGDVGHTYDITWMDPTS